MYFVFTMACKSVPIKSVWNGARDKVAGTFERYTAVHDWYQATQTDIPKRIKLFIHNQLPLRDATASLSSESISFVIQPTLLFRRNGLLLFYKMTLCYCGGILYNMCSQQVPMVFNCNNPCHCKTKIMSCHIFQCLYGSLKLPSLFSPRLLWLIRVTKVLSNPTVCLLTPSYSNINGVEVKHKIQAIPKCIICDTQSVGVGFNFTQPQCKGLTNNG